MNVIKRVAELINYCKDNGIKITQRIDEIASLFASIVAIKAESYLEIGSEYGGSLYVLAHALPVGSKICVVDYPLNAVKEECLMGVVNTLREEGYKILLISGDSHKECIVDSVKVLFDKPFDVAFIDGDHSYMGVKQDYKNYNTFVKDGGLIAFHNVSIPADFEKSDCDDPEDSSSIQKRSDVEVGKLWKELIQKYKSLEIDAGLKHRFGVGIIQNNIKDSKEHTIIGEFNGCDFNTYWK